MKKIILYLFLPAISFASYQPITGSTVTVNPLYMGGSVVSTTNPMPVQSTGTTTVTGTVTATLSGSINNTGFNSTILNVTTVTFNGTGQPVTGTFWQTTQPVLPVGVTTVTYNGTSQPEYLTNVATVTFNGVGMPVTSTSTYIVNIASVSGTSASGASPTGNPIRDGGEAFTAWPTAVSNAQIVDSARDKMGRSIDILDCPMDLQISTTVTLSASTSETLLLSSGAANTYNDLVAVAVSNSGSTAALVTFRNTGFGTTGWIHIFVPATDTRGLTTSHVWPQQASASDWTVQSSASTSSIYVDAVFCQRK